MSTIKRIVFPALVALALTIGPAMPAFAAFHENLRSKILNRPGAVQEKSETVPQKREEQRAEPKENVQEKRRGEREAVKEQRAAAKERLSIERSAKVRGLLMKTIRRFYAALERLEGLAKRIESRLSKARGAGRNVDAADTVYNQAQAARRDARAALDAVKAKLDLSRSAEDPRAALEGVRADLAAVKEKVKAAHAAFVAAITALKGLGGGAPTGAPAPTAQPAQ